jgi:signal transduction histidine kinase
MPDGSMQGAVASFTDITQMHGMLDRQRDLARTVSHDLRTPLTAIIGHAQLLLRALKKAGFEQRYLASAETIVHSAGRMDRMITDLVESTRLEIGQMRIEREPVEVTAFILDLLKRHEAIMPPSRVRVVPAEEVLTTCVDSYHLERILTNLLSNALKYSDPGSEVLLRTELRDGEVRVSIQDQGHGILPEDLPHLFDRFYRAKGVRKMEGLGLGLYITRMLVEAQGGRIWVESKQGQGSTFTFALPASDADTCG